MDMEMKKIMNSQRPLTAFITGDVNRVISTIKESVVVLKCEEEPEHIAMMADHRLREDDTNWLIIEGIDAIERAHGAKRTERMLHTLAAKSKMHGYSFIATGSDKSRRQFGSIFDHCIS